MHGKYRLILIAAYSCILLGTPSCTSAKSRLSPLTKKTIVYSLNGGPETRIDVDDVTPSELSFVSGDRLRIHAFEFTVGLPSEQLETPNVCVQVDIVEYVPYRQPDTWQGPQRGDVIRAIKGKNVAPGPKHEWKMTSAYNTMYLSIVHDTAPLVRGDSLQPITGVELMMLPDGKTKMAWGMERSIFVIIATEFPVGKILLIGLVLMAVIAAVIAVILKVRRMISQARRQGDSS